MALTYNQRPTPVEPSLGEEPIQTTLKSLTVLTAAGLMSSDLVCLQEEMPLREAACRLLRNRVGGAPVVNAQGQCVGVLSANDFLRLAEKRFDVTQPAAPPLPVTCAFQAQHRTSAGQVVTRCTLLPGVCPIQVRQAEPGGVELTVCSQPHCVLVDWQVAELEKLPADEVRHFMTPDPVTVPPGTPLRVLARMMIDAHVHRLIVVDEGQRPIGIISTTDLLAALAYADGEGADGRDGWELPLPAGPSRHARERASGGPGCEPW